MGAQFPRRRAGAAHRRSASAPAMGDPGSTTRVTAPGTNLATFCGREGAAQTSPAAPASSSSAPPRPPRARSLPRGRRLRAHLVPGLKKGSGDLCFARCRVFSSSGRKAESALVCWFVFFFCLGLFFFVVLKKEMLSYGVFRPKNNFFFF